MPAAPVLAIDLGGTKLAAALVEGGRVLARREIPTDRAAGPGHWIDDAIALVTDWSSFAAVGIAVTGAVRHGLWRALNPDTLPIPENYPLATEVARRLRLPVTARNDAQAAAWGEFRFGEAAGRDVIFVTVSTGLGGGIVTGGRLLEGRTGLAGHLGIAPIATSDGIRMLEEIASGSALARRAAAKGGPRAVTAAAHRGESWAEAMLDDVVAPLALALRRLQLELDPDRIVIGGGLGLAPGYLDRLRHHLAELPDWVRPTLTAATLGADAGLIGIADIAATKLEENNR